MTCKIDRTVSCVSLVTFYISGRITGSDVEIIRTMLGRENDTVAIDLTQVLLADCEVVKFLAACESNGNELKNCPAYIREWVTRERKKIKSTSSNAAGEKTEDA